MKQIATSKFQRINKTKPNRRQTDPRATNGSKFKTSRRVSIKASATTRRHYNFAENLHTATLAAMPSRKGRERKHYANTFREVDRLPRYTCSARNDTAGTHIFNSPKRTLDNLNNSRLDDYSNRGIGRQILIGGCRQKWRRCYGAVDEVFEKLR